MSTMTLKEDLLLNMRLAKAFNMKYYGVLVVNESNNSSEVIIINNKDLCSKIAYYEKAYDDDLRLKTFDAIRIKKYANSNDFSELENLALSCGF